MAVSFFGLAATLDPTTTLLVFIGLVLCLVLFEKALEEIETLAEEAGYADLVKKVYKEMMIMGFLGFGVFMAFNIFTLEHDENYLAFEFAHLTVFFIGIILVCRAVLAIVISSLSTKQNWLSHNAKCRDILERIEDSDKQFSMEGFLFKYMNVLSPLQRTIDFKLLEDYFHKDFNISAIEFRFVEYLGKHNIYYAIELTEVTLQSWFAIIFVVILNFIRIKVYDNDLHHCTGYDDDHHDDHHDDHTDDHRRLFDMIEEQMRSTESRLLSGDDSAEFHLSEECADFGTTYFLFCGALLIVFGFLICFANYWSLRKVAITGGYWTREEQINKLRELEKKEEGRYGSERVLVEHSETVWHVCSLRKVLEERKIEEYHHHIAQERKMKEFIAKLTHLCFETKAASSVQTVDAIKRLKNQNKQRLVRQPSDQSSLKGTYFRKGAVGEEKDEHPLLFEYDEPLFAHSRIAHRFMIECFQMLMALFIGIWATNYLFVTSHSSHSVAYFLITGCQMFIMLLIMSYLQIASSSLFAVTSLINEAADMMCEEDHIKAKLLPKIREEIIELTPEGTEMKEHLFNIYKFVNFDGDDVGIGPKEFSSMLFTVDLILPDNEVDILFRAVDSNGSGNIEFDELFELFRPDSNLISKSEEDVDSRHMKKLSHQISQVPSSASTAHKSKKNAVVPLTTPENESTVFSDLQKQKSLSDENL